MCMKQTIMRRQNAKRGDVYKRQGYMLTEGRKIEKIPEDAPVIMWKDFMKLSRSCYYKTYKVKREGADPAVILYSGGTTGTKMCIRDRLHQGRG